jgi:hypothetical protein
VGADFSVHASMLSSVQNHCKIHTQVPATIQSSASFPVMLCSWVAGTIWIRSRTHRVRIDFRSTAFDLFILNARRFTCSFPGVHIWFHPVFAQTSDAYSSLTKFYVYPLRSRVSACFKAVGGCVGADFSAHASMLSSVQNHCKIYTQVPATIQSSASFPVMLCSWVAGTIIMSSSRRHLVWVSPAV